MVDKVDYPMPANSRKLHRDGWYRASDKAIELVTSE